MRIDEARARKQALLSDPVLNGGGADGGGPDGGRPDGGGASGSAESVRVSQVPAAPFVGIVPSNDPDGYRLAVRFTRPVDDEGAVFGRIREVAGDDVDVRVVGEIRALSRAPLETGGEPAPALVGDDETPEPPTADPLPGAAPDFVPPTPEALQQRVRPLVRGLSVAHKDVTAGTIAGFVTRSDSTATHVLSNNHVLGDSDRGKPGDDVLQPGPYDGGTTADRIGGLLVAVPLDASAPNLVDCALAVLDDEVEVDPTAHDGAITAVIAPSDVVGQVAKIGRTTGYTLGRVTAVELDGVPVGYDTGVFTFDDQIEIEGVDGEFSAGGDSGSLIYTVEERHGVGLLFAGSTSGGSSGAGVTYANRLDNVLTALDATLLSPGELAT